ncbi:hypothetical protein B0H10DRAFT_1949017 [Mycena sp. CBHHK59/15]|nr:hypothetical protein B0H10DRAFT_1949017 [Mycena sp. CBHHK59/15]
MPLSDVHCQLSRGRLEHVVPPLWITATMDREAAATCGSDKKSNSFRSRSARPVVEFVPSVFEFSTGSPHAHLLYYTDFTSDTPGVRLTDLISRDVKYAVRRDGPAFYQNPTPENCKLDPKHAAYIKPTGFLESSVIIAAVSQAIAEHEWQLVVYQDDNGNEVVDWSELPVGLLGMGRQRRNPRDFSTANYRTAVAGFIKSIKKFRASRWESILAACGATVSAAAAEKEVDRDESLDGVREYMYIASRHTLGTDSAAKLINCSLTAVSRFFFLVADPQLVRNHCSKRSMVSSGLLLLTPNFWSQFQGADLNKSINSRSKTVCAVLRERNPTAITIDFGSHSISVTLSVFAAARTARMHVDFGQSVTHHLLQESTQACPENQRLCEFASKCGFTTELALARSTILVGTARMQVDSGESVAHRLVGGSLNRPPPTRTSSSVNVSVLTSEMLPTTRVRSVVCVS